MEEGFMLAFPEQVLHGQIPNRDFLHLYGPGGLWVLAAIYKAFGTNLVTERTVGLLQHLGIVFGVYALVRRWGRAPALVGALLVVFINITTAGLSALAWNGAVAFGLWALWCLLRAGEVGDDHRARRLLIIGGLLVSMALLYRPDLILAVGLGTGAALWRTDRRRLKWFALGCSLAIVGYLAQAALAGPGHAFKGMFLEPIFTLRGGRSLPIPPIWGRLIGYLQKAAVLRTVGWPFPQFQLAHQLYFWFVLMVVTPLFTLAVAVRAVRRDPERPRARALLVIGLFGLGLCTQGLQRIDQTHLSWVTCVTIATLPAAISELLHGHTLTRPRLDRLKAGATSFGVAFVLLCVLIPGFTMRGYVDVASQSFGKNTMGFRVARKARSFPLARTEIAGPAQQLVDAFDRLDPKPGERLFVGPVDLRHTPYADSFFYFLYPELPPATYFIEMDPFDSEPGSRLPDDVASADWLILSNVWHLWLEPNDSRLYGSDAANQVVRRDFCEVGHFGEIDSLPMYELYRRCSPRKSPT